MKPGFLTILVIVGSGLSSIAYMFFGQDPIMAFNAIWILLVGIFLNGVKE